MDSDVQFLFEKLSDGIKDLKKDNRTGHEKTEKHLVNAFSKIQEISKEQTKLIIQVTKVESDLTTKVTKVESDLQTHLNTVEEKKITKRKRWVSKRELALLIIAVVGSAVGIIRIFY